MWEEDDVGSEIMWGILTSYGCALQCDKMGNARIPGRLWIVVGNSRMLRGISLSFLFLVYI